MPIRRGIVATASNPRASTDEALENLTDGIIPAGKMQAPVALDSPFLLTIITVLDTVKGDDGGKYGG
jgi:hypothetical protein